MSNQRPSSSFLIRIEKKFFNSEVKQTVIYIFFNKKLLGIGGPFEHKFDFSVIW